MSPGGVRIGTPAMTSRGLKEAEFEKIGEFLHRGVEIALATQTKCGKKLVDFLKGLEQEESASKISALKAEVRRGPASSSCPATELQACVRPALRSLVAALTVSCHKATVADHFPRA
eukprot:TRINITY_DN3325_c0_g1_i1.p1 TRINITY_DN3325_c0_g1~~TRINITY_DN3325_c0_g1_i1.p1  ORF type:complete len:135 (-),score=5.94 TRINITY_DN3325_c0_g1_i1:83-433(-)